MKKNKEHIDLGIVDAALPIVNNLNEDENTCRKLRLDEIKKKIAKAGKDLDDDLPEFLFDMNPDEPEGEK